MQWHEFFRDNLKLPADMNSLADVKKKLRAEAMANAEKWAQQIADEFDTPLPAALELKIIRFVVNKVLKLAFG